MHLTRRLVAYNLHEGRMHRLHEPAPPFERWMLAARTAHEWAHLAVDAGWVAVPAHRRQEVLQLRAALAAQLETIAAELPAPLCAATAEHHRRLAAAHRSLGQALAAVALARLPDYQANLLAQRYLTADEIETYVRNNVASLAHDHAPHELLVRLARHAFEYQYLRFAQVRDPWRYFTSSTFFPNHYLRSGAITIARTTELFATMARVCDCHEVDSSWVRASPPDG
ncbi:MAG: hypothetical protein U1E76_00485 [Planctomycetota bacterium]